MKKVIGLLVIVGAVFLFYYLAIRSFEFDVNFKAKTSSGDLIETLRIWNKSLEGSAIVSVDSFAAVHQTIRWNNVQYSYEWHIKALNDSITHVTVQISQPGRSFLNKLLIPFSEQRIEKDAAEIVGRFYKVVQTHLEITDVRIVGLETSEKKFCACRTLETEQTAKARGMMKDYSILTAFVADLKLKLAGPPIVRVSNWSHEQGKLKFDFCFPIQQADSLPEVKGIVYKEFPAGKVLKAEYRGNYITSDRAWYALYDYARRNGIEVSGLPIEYFHNNPTLGVNEKEWKADVFIPVRN